MLTQTYASLSLMAGSNKVIMHIKPKNIPLLKEIKFHYQCKLVYDFGI